MQKSLFNKNIMKEKIEKLQLEIKDKLDVSHFCYIRDRTLTNKCLHFLKTHCGFVMEEEGRYFYATGKTPQNYPVQFIGYGSRECLGFCTSDVIDIYNLTLNYINFLFNFK